MAFWTSNFLAARRQAWLDCVDRIQYYTGATWNTAAINEKGISQDGALYFKATTLEDANLTISQVRFLDSSGTVIGLQNVNIRKADSKGQFLYFEFPLYEIES